MRNEKLVVMVIMLLWIALFLLAGHFDYCVAMGI